MELRTTNEFDAWLHGLKDIRAQARISMRIRRLGNGNPGNHRNLKGGVSELKIDEGKGYRVYYTQRGTQLTVLLCGGDKSSKAQQQRDIARAQRMAAEIRSTL